MIIDKRCDFVLLFDVQDGNPNGDPDAGNLPRVDPETGHGLVTDVCLKRKVRNYVLTAKKGQAPHEIYVKEGSVLNQQHARGYQARNIQLATPVEAPIPKDLLGDPGSLVGALPDGFAVEKGDEEGSFLSRYEGNLDKAEIKEALEMIQDLHGPEVAKHFGDLTKKTKSRKATKEERGDVRAWMCDTFFDVRCFGAVMSTKVNAGQVRGPVQLTFARSIDPIVTLEHSITRMAVATEAEAEKQGGDNRTMGRKATVPYGLYRAYGFVSPALAERGDGRRVQGTGFSVADLDLLWTALENMFEHDRSAARGLMTTRKLVIFEHQGKLGEEHASKLFDRVKVERNDKSRPARCFGDYKVTIEGLNGDAVTKTCVRIPVTAPKESGV
jgi:CRISPR-associated protein Csd2